MFSFLILCHIALGFITHDEGYCRDFHLPYVSNFPCTNGYSKTSTNQFSGVFANPPKVILTIESLDQSDNSCQNYFTITSVTTTSFQIQIKCLTGRLFSTGIHWYAIDDERIQVIDKFNTTDFSEQIIPHQNPNAIVGFITLFSVSFSGKINFGIQITSITTTDVTVQITNPSSLLGNLKQISYQIVLGVPEAITILSTLSLTANYFSPDIPVIPNTFFLLATNGYNYIKTDNIRLYVTFNSQDPIQYSLRQWSTGPYVGNTHTQVFLYHTFTQYKQLKLDSVRISQYQSFDSCFVSYQPLTILIQEISKTFTQTGTFSELIDKSFSQINFVISLSCELNKKIKSQFYMYQPNFGIYQMKTQFHYCGGQNKVISYYIRFKQQNVAYQDLVLQITNAGCQLLQIITNQVKITEVLFQFDIIDACIFQIYTILKHFQFNFFFF